MWLVLIGKVCKTNDDCEFAAFKAVCFSNDAIDTCSCAIGYIFTIENNHKICKEG